jgi:hypothetical protein
MYLFVKQVGKGPMLGDPENMATNGAFAWPVTFELSAPANSTNGGWIIQHVIRRTQATINGVPTGGPILNFWEAFRVNPGKLGPTPKPPTNRQVLFGLSTVGINIKGIKANDWYGVMPSNGSSGWTDYKGEVYYLDNMATSDLPTGPNGFSQTAIPASGGAPAMANSDMPVAWFQVFLREFNAIGPVRHDITVLWTRTKTEVESQDPTGN